MFYPLGQSRAHPPSLTTREYQNNPNEGSQSAISRLGFFVPRLVELSVSGRLFKCKEVQPCFMPDFLSPFFSGFFIFRQNSSTSTGCIGGLMCLCISWLAFQAAWLLIGCLLSLSSGHDGWAGERQTTSWQYFYAL